MRLPLWLSKFFGRKSSLRAAGLRGRTGKGKRTHRRAVLSVEWLDQRVAPSVSTIGVFDPGSGIWHLRDSNTPGGANAGEFAYGSPNAISVAVAGDWNGDGVFTVGVAEKSGNVLVWKLRNSNTPGAPDIAPFAYGRVTDIPVVGDWDGNGTYTVGVYEPDTGVWKLRNSNTPGAPDLTFAYGGLPGTTPVVGDWDGNKTSTVGVTEKTGSVLTWKLRNSNSAGAPDITPFPYGAAGWAPVAGDWNGDGIWTAGVFDPIGQFGQPPASWYYTNTNSNSAGGPAPMPFAFGAAGWTPISGHWTAKPTLDAIADQVVLEDAGAQTLNLSGISSGGANRTLAITAVSGNPALVPDPTVTYTSPSATGLLSYTSAAHQAGMATVTVTVRDAGPDGQLGNADDDTFARTFTITVVRVNDAPAGTGKTVTTREDTAYTFTAADFGFTDPADTPPNNFLAVKVTTLPGAGALADGGVAVSAGQFVPRADLDAGKLVFTPAAGGTGSPYASFTFQVQDDGGTANGGADLDPTPRTMTIDVARVNDAPAGADNTVILLADTVYTFTAADFGFTDPADTPPDSFLAVKVTTLPGAGALADGGVAVSAGQFVPRADLDAGKLVFTPAAGGTGSPYASFTFQVQDNGGTANGGADLDPVPNTLTLNVTRITAAQGINISATENNNTGPAALATFTDVKPGDHTGDFSVSVTWGDGTPADTSATVTYNGTDAAGAHYTVTGSHTFAEEGSYPVAVVISATGSNSTAAGQAAMVDDAALTVTAGNDISPTEGTSTGPVALATFTDVNPGDHTGDFKVSVSWGDGTPADTSATVAYTGTDAAGAHYTVTGSHTYAEEGSRVVAVTVTDLGGNSAGNGFNALVNDAALTATPGNSFTATPGVNTGPVVLATFADANPGDHTGDFSVSVNWGDNTPADTSATVAYTGTDAAGAHYTITGSHTYAAAGPHTATINITDAGGSTALASLIVR